MQNASSKSGLNRAMKSSNFVRKSPGQSKAGTFLMSPEQHKALADKLKDIDPKAAEKQRQLADMISLSQQPSASSASSPASPPSPTEQELSYALQKRSEAET